MVSSDINFKESGEKCSIIGIVILSANRKLVTRQILALISMLIETPLKVMTAVFIGMILILSLVITQAAAFTFSGVLNDPFGTLPAGTAFSGSISYDGSQPLNTLLFPWRGDYQYTSFSVTIGNVTVTDNGPGTINVYDHDSNGGYPGDWPTGYPTDLFHLYPFAISGTFGGLTLDPGAGLQLVLQDLTGTVFSNPSLPSGLSLNDFTIGNATFLQLQSTSTSWPFTVSARGELTTGHDPCWSSDPLFFSDSVNVPNPMGSPNMLIYFTPKNGCTLDQVAEAFGYDHFNWVNLATWYPFAGYLRPPQANRFIDPPLGLVSSEDFGNTDNLDYYYDEGGVNLGTYDHLDYHVLAGRTTLRFFDVPKNNLLWPFPPLNEMRFTTMLAGVKNGNNWVPLHSVSWKSNYNGDRGEVTILSARDLTDPVGGTGGVFDIVQHNTPEDIPLDARSLLVESGATNIPLPSSPPQANAGIDLSLECLDLTCPVILDGAGSTDPDSSLGTQDDIVLYEWYDNYGDVPLVSVATATSTVDLSLGDHNILLVVTDSTGITSMDTILVHVNPAHLSLLELKKVEVEWKKGRIKLHGKVVLPVGRPHPTIEPIGALNLNLSSLGNVVSQAVTFMVKGHDDKKWKYEADHSTTGITKFNIDWKGAKVEYDGTIHIKSEILTEDSTTLEIDRKGLAGSFSMTVIGEDGTMLVTVDVDNEGNVTASDPRVIIDVDDDKEIELGFPFSLGPGMIIELNGNGITDFPVLVSDYYTASVGKFEIDVIFDQGTLDVSSLTPTLDMEVNLGAEGFPGNVAIAPSDWKDLKPKEWKYEQE